MGGASLWPVNGGRLEAWRRYPGRRQVQPLSRGKLQRREKLHGNAQDGLVGGRSFDPHHQAPGA